MNDDRLTELEEHIDRLTEAYRALSAQHTALMAVCRVMLPLISTTPEMRLRLLTSAYDIYSAHMQADWQDDEYQRLVRETIDLVSASIIASAGYRSPPENPAGSPDGSSA